MREETPLDIKNWVIFLAGSLVILLAWQLVAPPPPPPPTPEEVSETDATEAPPLEAPVEGTALPATAEPVEARQADAVERRTLTTPHARVELTTVGGRVTSWKLPGEPSYWDPEHDLDLVRHPWPENAEAEGDDAPPLTPQRVPDDADVLPLQVVTGDPALDARLASALHVVEVSSDSGRRRVTMSWSDGAGTSVEKTLTLWEELPVATVEARLTVAGRPASFRLAWGPGIGDHSPEERKNMYFRRGRLTWMDSSGKHHAERPDKADELPQRTVAWAALEDSYYTVIAIPAVPGRPEVPARATGFRLGGELSIGPDGELLGKDAWPDHLVLEIPFAPTAAHQTLYLGARDAEQLRALEMTFARPRQLEELLDLGTFIGPIASLMRTLLVWLHDHVGNWGLAIILLTLIIRGVLFPLTHVSLKKMRLLQDKMKVLKPQLDALKARHARQPRTFETRQREQQEMMELYKKVGINPADQLLGCLPILISLPFFWALFRLLQGAPEFRYEGFLGWDDLSAADPTHVWPLVTGATTFLSQRVGMSGSAAQMEPIQRNMLYMFPIMFVFFCWSAPLGLVVYWTANNFIQLGQQYLLKLTLPAPPEPEPQGTKGKKKKPRSADASATQRDDQRPAEDASPGDPATAGSTRARSRRRSKKRRKR